MQKVYKSVGKNFRVILVATLIVSVVIIGTTWHKYRQRTPVSATITELFTSTTSPLMTTTTNFTSTTTAVGSLVPFDYPIAQAMLDYVESNYKPNSISVKELAVILRIMTRIRVDLQPWMSTGKHQDPLVSSVHTGFLERLRKVELLVYPFLNNKTIEQWIASYSGRGIVMSAASKHMRYVVYLLKNLEAVGCDLPIELVTEDANQLSPEHKTMLTNLGVKLIYLPDVLDNSEAQFGGYAMKPAAMVASSFREAILIDCDDVFVRNPQLLFDEDGYKTTGTLYFFDQHDLHDPGHRVWVLANLPKPLSERVHKSETLKGRARDIDSSAVLMDKTRSFYGLIAAARLNMKRESAVLYPIFWGDSELWWLAFEMVAYPYSISPHPAGSIGPVSGNEVCGKIMHVGNDGRPFFWNQGFLQRKDVKSEELLNFEAFSRVGVIFKTPPTYCVKGSDPLMLKEDEVALIENLKKLWLSTTGFAHW